MPHSLTDDNLHTLASVILVICNTLKDNGIDPAPLCDSAALSIPEVLNPKQHETIAKVAHLASLAVEATEDPCFTLQVARRLRLNTFSSYGINACESLTEAVHRCQLFSEQVTGSVLFTIRNIGNLKTICLQGPAHTPRLDDELALFYLAGGLQLSRSLKSSEIVSVEVCLQRRRPKNPQPFIDFFACPVLFEQDENNISVCEKVLLPALNPQRLHKHQQPQHLDTQISYSGTKQFAQEVSLRIENLLGEGEPKIAVIATAMGLSSRSLQRKLAAEKHTFAQLLDDTRKRMAHEMVLRPSQQIKNLAYELGFSDQSNFNRAFKRWFSVSPTMYRRNFRADTNPVE